MTKHILHALLVILSSILIYITQNHYLLISLFFIVLISTLNKNYFSIISIIPLFFINQSFFFVYLIFYVLLLITTIKINQKKYKIPAYLISTFSLILSLYFLREFNWIILVISLFISIIFILTNELVKIRKKQILYEALMLILFSLNVIEINKIFYIILFTLYIVIHSIINNKSYYIFTSFFIAITSYILTDNLIYILIQIIAYLCYFLNKFIKRNKEDNQIEYIIEDINNNVTNFCSFLNSFNTVSFDSDYEKRLSQSIKILISNYCLNCKNKGACYSQKKMKTYIFLKQILTNKKQANKTNDNSCIFDCIYYFDISEKALLLQSQYKLNEEFILDDLKISTVCLSIQNYFIATFDKISPKVIKLINFKKKLIDSNVMFYEFKHRIINEDNYEFKIYSNTNKDLNTIKEIATSFLKHFSPVITIHTNYVSIHPKTKYKINYDSATLSVNNHQISGDNILIKTVNETNFICALSDGMGSGFNAYKLSEETLMMVEKILECNISFDSALQIINNFFKARDKSDSFATLDLIDIDLKSGILNLYKLGSSTTYISRGDKIIPIYNNNLPFGISELITNEEFNVCDNDLIVLVSDGVNDYINESTLISYIESLKNETPHKIVYEILEKIYHENHGIIKDDMSCIAIKIKSSF